MNSCEGWLIVGNEIFASFEVVEPFVVDVRVPNLVMIDHDAIVIIDGDKALIEGTVVEGVEQQPVGCGGFLNG